MSLHRIHRALVLPLLTAFAIGCGGDDGPTGNTCTEPPGPTVHSGDITANETWTKCGNPHFVEGMLDVSGPSSPILTLGPGVVVRFAAGPFSSRQFRVGYQQPGGIVINGTAAEPVSIISGETNAAAGDFVGIVLMSESVGSSIKHLIIQDCGDAASLSAFLDACIIAQGVANPVLMQHVTVRRSASKGIVFAEGSRFASGSTNLSISNAAEYPVMVDPGQAHTLPPNGSYTNNFRDMILLWGLNGDVLTTGTWIHPGVPYLVDISLNIDGPLSPVLTLAPGTTLRMARDTKIEVGAFDGGALNADGSPTQKITITADTAEAAFWIGIEVAAEATSAMKLDHVILEYGGGFFGYSPGDEGNILIRPILPAFITNSTIRNSAECGIVLARYEAELGFVDYTASGTGNTFANNPLGNLCGLYPN